MYSCHISLFIHPLMDTWVTSTFWLLGIALLWTLCVSFWDTHAIVSPRYIPRSKNAGWYSKSMSNCLRNHQAVFHCRRTTTLHSRHWHMSVPISPYPQLLFSVTYFFFLWKPTWRWSQLLISEKKWSCPPRLPVSGQLSLKDPPKMFSLQVSTVYLLWPD